MLRTKVEKVRSWQGSNLRGQSPLDFKSNALTTRPQLHMMYEHDFLTYVEAFYLT